MLVMTGCRSRHRQPAIGEAFVAPISLNLREELAPRAAVTAVVKHGDRLEILERRRRFAKVRTSEGAEGWTDGRQLLSPAGMARLRKADEWAKSMPSQARATPFDVLNVHIESNRASPSFAQISETTAVDVLARRVTPRIPYVPDQPRANDPVPGDILRDDWSLVRLPDRRSGWVLSRMLMMNLPDEVTQQAEGHRITSFFPLGAVTDKNGQPRESWLWTTISKPPEHYQFDSLRVFVWNPRRHRYQSTYVERGLRGYYPVTVEKALANAWPKVHILAERDGQLYSRTFEFRNHHFREVERRAASRPPADPDENLPLMLPDPAEISWWERTKGWIKDRWRR
jgi:hypothetical protein